MNKYILLVLALLALTFMISGCSLVPDEGLFALPNLPREYVSLQNEINKIISGGAEYAVAETGANRQAVQLVDLNADGQNEAIAFFIMNGGAIRAYVFRYNSEGEYEEEGFVESYGRRIWSVDYPEISRRGDKAIAISTRYDDSVTYGLTIASPARGEIVTMLDLQYSAVLFEDSDEDGVEEIFFAISNGASGAFSAHMYKLSGDEYKPVHSCQMCTEVKTVSNMQIGFVAEDRKALFIDSAANGGGYVSDVLTLDGSTPVNLSVDAAGGSGMSTWRASSVYCRDINEDGITDVPVFEGGELRNLLSWKDLAEDETTTVLRTYYNVTDRWYMDWPEKWENAVSAERKSADEITTMTFFVPQTQSPELQGEVRNAIFTIYVFTGENSAENLKSYRTLDVLSSSGGTIYGCLLIENDYKQYSLSEEEVRKAFHVIEQSWNTEDYLK